MSHRQQLERLLPAAGIPMEPAQLDRLATYADWLADEALRAGGIGPAEADRIIDRHVLDALTFLLVFQQVDHAPTAITDLGSGVGLPGIPLAVALPGTPVHLVDRSGRRLGLAARAIRMLGLDNAETHQEEFESLSLSPTDTVVARAALPPSVLLPVVERQTGQSGVGVVAASRWERVDSPPFRTLRLDLEVLDQTRWFLIMAPSLPAESGGGA